MLNHWQFPDWPIRHRLVLYLRSLIPDFTTTNTDTYGLADMKVIHRRRGCLLTIIGMAVAVLTLPRLATGLILGFEQRRLTGNEASTIYITFASGMPSLLCDEVFNTFGTSCLFIDLTNILGRGVTSSSSSSLLPFPARVHLRRASKSVVKSLEAEPECLSGLFEQADVDDGVVFQALCAYRKYIFCPPSHTASKAALSLVDHRHLCNTIRISGTLRAFIPSVFPCNIYHRLLP